MLFEHAVNQRVSFVIGSAFFVNGEGHQYARLSYSAPTAERIREGVARLQRALDAALTDSSSIESPQRLHLKKHV